LWLSHSEISHFEGASQLTIIDAKGFSCYSNHSAQLRP
jgi:hypothetical protein